MRFIHRWTRQAALALVIGVAAAACGDPTAPRPTTAKATPTTKVLVPNMDFWTEAWPNYGAPSRPGTTSSWQGAYDYCLANIDTYGSLTTVDQAQRLVWNDSREQYRSYPNEQGTDTLFKGRVKIVAKYYETTWMGSSPLKCIKLVGDTLFRAVSQHKGINILDQAINYAVHKYGTSYRQASNGGFGWCVGTAAVPIYTGSGYNTNITGAGGVCDSYDGASIKFNAILRYYRQCDIRHDAFDGSHNWPDLSPNGYLSSVYTLGGESTATMQWQYQIWARSTPSTSYPDQAGWWTVNDYGGNNYPHTDGSWAGGAAQVQLCDMYDYEVTNWGSFQTAVYNANVGGQATWSVYWPNSSWPNGTF